LSGTATAGKMLQSGATAAPTWSTPTYPSSSGSAGKIIRSDGTNNVYSTSTFADTYTASNLLYSNGSNTVTGLATANNGTLVTSATGVPSILAGPGTTGSIFQSNAAAAPSWSTATYPSVATSSGTILRANGTNWVASTATFADTYTASNLLYSNGSNTVTGLATANNGTLVTSSTGVPSILAGPGASGKILQSNSAAAPSWSTPTYPSASGSSGQIIRSDGTNNVYTTATYPTTTTINQLLYSSAANTIAGLTTQNGGVLVTSNTGVPSILAGSGTTGTVLQATASGTPAWSTATYPATTTINQVLYSSAANVVSGLATANSSVLGTTSTGTPIQLGTMTNGQMIIGSTGATPAVGTITGSGNITVTTGAGTLALSLTGPASMTYASNTGTSATLNAFAAIIPINTLLFTFTLAATASVGDVFEIVGRGSGGWVLNLNVGQTIFGTGFSTSSGGSVTSTDRYNSIRFVCVVANTAFVVSSIMGNPTFA